MEERLQELPRRFFWLYMYYYVRYRRWQDVQKGTEPDYRTDYYMIVESKAGGVDIYSDPDLDSTKLNDSLIPNGTALRIEGEVEDEKDKRLWGYTQYHGMYGYVPEDESEAGAVTAGSYRCRALYRGKRSCEL